MNDEPHRLWSTTTLIDQGLPKEALKWWARNTTAEYAVTNARMIAQLVEGGNADEALTLVKAAMGKTRRAAAFRGSQLHKAAEMLAYGEPLGDEFRGIEPYVDQYRRFLNDHRPIYKLAEAPVYNATERYAGTLDSIVELPAYPNRDLLMDAKTSDKPRDTEGGKPPYPEIALQLVAYAHAEWVDPRPGSARMGNWQGRRYYVVDDFGHPLLPMPKVEGALALAIFPDNYTLQPVVIDETVWQAFLHVREVARWALVTSHNVLGKPIDPAFEEAAA
jgi:hypothetical protein